MALRDRIAETLWPLAEWEGEYSQAEEAADAVLKLPEISLALRFAKACSDAGLLAELAREMEKDQCSTTI